MKIKIGTLIKFTNGKVAEVMAIDFNFNDTTLYPYVLSYLDKKSKTPPKFGWTGKLETALGKAIIIGQKEDHPEYYL